MSYKEGERLSSDIDEGLDEIAKNTIKSYQATQHLFSDTLMPVTKDLKQFADIARRIREDIAKSKIVEIDSIKKDIDGLLEAIKKKKDLGLQLKENGKILLNLENLRQKYEDRRKELTEGGDFKRLGEAKSELNKIEEGLAKKRNKVIELFSPLETGLKKFKRVTFEDEDLVGEYVDSAFDALLADKELKIIGILSRMEQSIQGGSVELKGHKKEKTLEGIKEMTSEKLKRILAEYRELINQKDIAMKRIGKNPVKSQIKDIEYKAEHNLFKLKKLKENIEELEKKYNQVDLKELKKNLEEKIKDIINIELIISSVS
jgi:hypothetical protein